MNKLDLTVQEVRIVYGILRYIERHTDWLEDEALISDLDFKVHDFLRETGDLVPTSWELT